MRPLDNMDSVSQSLGYFQVLVMDNFIGEFRGNVPARTCQGLIALFNEAHKRKLTNPGRTGKVEGKTLIWPAGFTHTHRGRPAPDEVKFIITGWFCFAPRPR